MRRLILWVVTTLVTFALGVGTDRVTRQQPVDKVPLPPKTETVRIEVPVPMVALVSAAPDDIPNPTLILDYDAEKFVPIGIYSFLGPTPKEFADFDSVEVALSGSDGYISFNLRSEDYKYDSASAIFALVTERRLFFVTSKTGKSDFEYRFDGEFLRTDFVSVMGKNKAVLRGTLTKTKDGRKVAERTVSFRVEHLGC